MLKFNDKEISINIFNFSMVEGLQEMYNCKSSMKKLQIPSQNIMKSKMFQMPSQFIMKSKKFQMPSQNIMKSKNSMSSIGNVNAWKW